MLTPYVVAAITGSTIASNLSQFLDDGPHYIDDEDTYFSPYQYLDDDYNDAEVLTSQTLNSYPYNNNHSYGNYGYN